MTQLNGSHPVVNRGKIKHKQQNRLMVLQILAERAQKELDAERVESILNEIDEITSGAVESIPASWGVSMADRGWLGEITAEQYEEIMALIRPQSPGKKTDSDTGSTNTESTPVRSS